jgi:outer membrane protein insertion porin family
VALGDKEEYKLKKTPSITNQLDAMEYSCNRDYIDAAGNKVFNFKDAAADPALVEEI